MPPALATETPAPVTDQELWLSHFSRRGTAYFPSEAPLTIGSRMHWTDPEGLRSGLVEILAVGPLTRQGAVAVLERDMNVIVLVRLSDGQEVEAFPCELHDAE